MNLPCKATIPELDTLRDALWCFTVNPRHDTPSSDLSPRLQDKARRPVSLGRTNQVSVARTLPISVSTVRYWLYKSQVFPIGLIDLVPSLLAIPIFILFSIGYHRLHPVLVVHPAAVDSLVHVRPGLYQKRIVIEDTTPTRMHTFLSINIILTINI